MSEIEYIKDAKDIPLTSQVLQNRFDIIYDGNYDICIVKENEKEIKIPVHIEKQSAYVGLWLTKISKELLERVIQCIFKNRKNVECVILNEVICPPAQRWGGYSPTYLLNLPESEQELRNRMTKKSRYNMQRTKRIVREEFGEFEIKCYENEKISQSLLNEYMRMKKRTHHTEYDTNITVEDYIKKYHVTNVYSLCIEDKIYSLLFSCEQCDIVYLENLTYDALYEKYSFGAILYDEVILRLIEKGKKGFFLGGGNYQYKRKYGSEEILAFHGIRYRNVVLGIIRRIQRRLRGK